MVCWVHRAVERQHYYRASLVGDDSIPVRFGYLVGILVHGGRACQDHVSVICHKSWHFMVNSRCAKPSSILAGLLACRHQKSRRKSIFSSNYFNCQMWRDSWKIWAAANSDEWVWLQLYCMVSTSTAQQSTNRSITDKRLYRFLLPEPELLILDEPTVGVDPVLRKSIWDHLVNITKLGKKTVIITTHYIEETRQAHVVSQRYDLVRHLASIHSKFIELSISS